MVVLKEGISQGHLEADMMAFRQEAVSDGEFILHPPMPLGHTGNVLLRGWQPIVFYEVDTQAGRRQHFLGSWPG